MTKSGLRVLQPLPSASNATSQSRGWLILGLTGVGDLPRSDRSKPHHFSASAKNGSFLNTSDILSDSPLSQVLQSILSSNITRDSRNNYAFGNRQFRIFTTLDLFVECSVLIYNRWLRVCNELILMRMLRLHIYIYNAASCTRVAVNLRLMCVCV